MQSINFIKQTVFEKKIFLRRRFKKKKIENLPFLGPQQPIKISDQDEGHLKHSALLNKHFSKNKIQIPPMRLQNSKFSLFPIISLWKLKVAIATRVLI